MSEEQELIYNQDHETIEAETFRAVAQATQNANKPKITNYSHRKICREFGLDYV